MNANKRAPLAEEAADIMYVVNLIEEVPMSNLSSLREELAKTLFFSEGRAAAEAKVLQSAQTLVAQSGYWCDLGKSVSVDLDSIAGLSPAFVELGDAGEEIITFETGTLKSRLAEIVEQLS